MPVPIFIYLEWEIRLYLDLLHGNIADFVSNEQTLALAIEKRLPLTVNHFRKSIPGVTPHPDERGNMKVWEENVEKPEDAVIPPEVLAGMWNKIVKEKSAIVVRTEQDSFEFLTQYFAQLYAEAKATGLPIFKSFEDVPKQERP